MKLPLFHPYEKYMIDTNGNVYGLDGRIMKSKPDNNGYLRVCLYNNKHRKFKNIHRIVAQMFLPDFNEKLDVDHKNRIRHDNRVENLRMVTRQQNSMNRPKQVNNTSGYKGLYWDKRNKKWHSRIYYNGKNIHLGYFNDIEEAREAYNKKAKELYGEYAYIQPKQEKLKIKFIMNITNATINMIQPNQ